jgi:uncharacterized protein YjiS (DUF1127 family)
VATIDSFSTFRPLTPMGDTMGRLVARLDAWLFRRREHADLVRSLRLLTERDMQDLGISRADFPSIIDGTYRR